MEEVDNELELSETPIIVDNVNEMKEVIHKMLNSAQKGVFLLDETPPAVGLRLAELEKSNEVGNRFLYYKLFISALDQQKISALSLSYECLYYIYTENLLEEIGDILIGLRVDLGITPLNYRTKKECYTEGLTSLTRRLSIGKEKDCFFARWRSVFTVGSEIPTYFCILENCRVLGRFAATSQALKLVPLLEVELLKEGGYSLEVASRTLETILAILIKSLIDENCCISETVLQVDMVSGGKDSEEIYTAYEIAEATLNALKKTLPTGIGGVLISSGGLSEEDSSLALSSIMEKINSSVVPWPVTYAFGRALQHSALKIWAGIEENEESAKNEFSKRLEANTIALSGEYTSNAVHTIADMENLCTDQYIY